MNQIDNISTAIDKAVTGIDKISAEWEGSDKLPADKMKECIDLIGEARQRCQSIQEKVRKAQSVEMTIAGCRFQEDWQKCYCEQHDRRGNCAYKSASPYPQYLHIQKITGRQVSSYP